MIEAMKDGEDVEDWITRYEAHILRRERYDSDARYKRDVEWWTFYTRNGCDTLRQLLQRPDHVDRYEEIRALLEKRMARLKNLEQLVSEGKEYMKQWHVKTVVVDIDQTIADNGIYFMLHHYNNDLQLGLTPERIAVAACHYATTLQVPEVSTFQQDHAAEFETSRQKIKNSPAFALSLPVLPNAVEGVVSLCEIGDIRYYTVRQPEIADTTKEWLIRKGFPNPQEVHLCANPRDKLLKIIQNEILEDHETTGVVLLIDDRYIRLIKAAKAFADADATMKEALSRLVFVAFGVTDEDIQRDISFAHDICLNMLTLPSWNQEQVAILKRHFYRKALNH